MARDRFDRLARFVVASATRRTATRVTFGAALVGLGLGGSSLSGDAKPRRKHHKRCRKNAQACTPAKRPACCLGPCGCASDAATDCTCRITACLGVGGVGCQSDADCCTGSCVSFGGPGSCIA